ncbi:MAG: cytochrome P450 [Acidobacteria bacterium]|nr:cytochrome P450 [Acidobacteriota bacterium]
MAAAAASLPPGPKGTPIIGVLRPFLRNQMDFLMRIAREHGELAYFRLGNQDVIFVNDPNLIQDVLVNQHASMRKSRVLERAKVLLGEGLLTSDGEFHLRQRRLVQPAFHRDRLMAYAATMAELSTRYADRWTAGETRDIHRDMMRLALLIVGKTLFSADVEGDADAIGKAMTDVLSLFDIAVLPFSEALLHLPFPASRRFHRARQVLDQTIYRIIEERRRSGVDAGDLLSMLMLADDEDGGGGMSDRQVRDEALTLFIAGHETTANALTWTWYLLSQDSRAEAAFHRELDTVLGDRPPRAEDYAALVYTQAVFAESLRLFPPAWGIGRKTKQVIQLGGYDVPAGTILLMSPYVMHRNPRYWRNADAFVPERFLEEDPARPKFAYLPFGGGVRLCIGERFAWMEGVLALAAIGRRWRLRLSPGHRVEKHAQITLRPRYGMQMSVESRR